MSSASRSRSRSTTDMWPAVWPGVDTSRTLPSPKRSNERPNVANESGVRRLEVERPPVEGVVELAAPVALECARPSRPPPTRRLETTKVDSGNSAIPLAWSEWRWVITTTPTCGGLDAERAQLRRHGLLRLHRHVLDHAPRECARTPRAAPSRSRGGSPCPRARGPAPGMLHEERDHRHLHPLVARHADPERAERCRAGPPRGAWRPAASTNRPHRSGRSRHRCALAPPGSGSEAGRGSAAVAIAAHHIRVRTGRFPLARGPPDRLGYAPPCPPAPSPASSERLLALLARAGARGPGARARHGVGHRRGPAARRGPDERGPLRLPRPGPVPLPVAERLLHRAATATPRRAGG